MAQSVVAALRIVSASSVVDDKSDAPPLIENRRGRIVSVCSSEI